MKSFAVFLLLLVAMSTDGEWYLFPILCACVFDICFVFVHFPLITVVIIIIITSSLSTPLSSSSPWSLSHHHYHRHILIHYHHHHTYHGRHHTSSLSLCAIIIGIIIIIIIRIIILSPLKYLVLSRSAQSTCTRSSSDLQAIFPEFCINISCRFFFSFSFQFHRHERVSKFGLFSRTKPKNVHYRGGKQHWIRCAVVWVLLCSQLDFYWRRLGKIQRGIQRLLPTAARLDMPFSMVSWYSWSP